MMVAEFIRDVVLAPRHRQHGCLVVYDHDRRYRQLCLAMASQKVRVIDASESSIDSREAALEALQEIGHPSSEVESLIVYVPSRKPETDEHRQGDPFALYSSGGATFPQDDGDEYLNLCLRAKPDHVTEIRRVFEATPNPSFSVIDAIGAGTSWPQLRSTLKVESAREVLHAILAPTDSQMAALKEQDGWLSEAKEFVLASLGMNVKTRGKTWSAFADELWRYVLFSEFVFDLPGVIPEAIKAVPRAPNEARPVVEDVCDRVRSDPKTRSLYIQRAEAIESELNLPVLCSGVEDLGIRDTFPFEERSFLRLASKALVLDDSDIARRVIDSRKGSVWVEKGESQAQWEVVRASLMLLDSCADLDRQLLDRARTQADLIDFYLASLREADRLQREFEQAVGTLLDEHGEMAGVMQHARKAYRRLSEKVQALFMRHAEGSGWPPAGRMANAGTFDRLVSERVKDRGRRVAYLMVDALRYELGVELQKMLSDDGPVEIQAAYAQLPSITLVGMASLLPGANSELTLSVEEDVLIPKLGSNKVGNVRQRMDVLSKRYGDRFLEMTLNDFVRGKPKIAEVVDLLVLRSTEIDSQLESNPESTLGLIPNTLKMIRVALHKLRGLGFKDAIIVTDHGFFLNAHAEAGDVCAKPQGNWPITSHDRMMFGTGPADSNNAVIACEKLGIRGGLTHAALPRSMAPYRSGHLYFHGGLSLAEAVVPVLIARLEVKDKAEARHAVIQLSYKNGSKKITTRLPVIDVTMVSGDMFSQGAGVEILLEAQDPKGAVVGEPRAGGEVNPATGTITLTPGQRLQIALRMSPDYEGKVIIRALNPTTLAAYFAVTLETDYTV